MHASAAASGATSEIASRPGLQHPHAPERGLLVGDEWISIPRVDVRRPVAIGSAQSREQVHASRPPSSRCFGPGDPRRVMSTPMTLPPGPTLFAARKRRIPPLRDRRRLPGRIRREAEVSHPRKKGEKRSAKNPRPTAGGRDAAPSRSIQGAARTFQFCTFASAPHRVNVSSARRYRGLLVERRGANERTRQKREMLKRSPVRGLR